MRHLMSPLDFSVEELDQLLDLADDIEMPRSMHMHVTGKNLPLCFMSQVPEPASVLKLP